VTSLTAARSGGFRLLRKSKSFPPFSDHPGEDMVNFMAFRSENHGSTRINQPREPGMILVARSLRYPFFSLIVFVLSILVWNPDVSEAEDEGRTLRIMTYNIHHCEGVDGKLDVERIAGVIRKQECDLVALQEVDRNTLRSQRVDQLAELGRLTGLQPYFGKAIDYGGGEYGLGILSRLPILESKLMQLPSGSNREKRIVIEVVVQPKTGPRFVFACTHLDHSSGENDRAQQIKELKKLFGGGPSQAILAGDFNCTSDNTELAPILAYWSDVDAEKMSPTIPVAMPNRKIDYIFLQRDCPWSVDSAQVLDEPVASDHLPLISTFRLSSDRAK